MDKIDRLLDAIEHPESYTQSDIEAMLQDPEVKEVFDLLDKTKSSLKPIPAPDIEAEWKKFEEGIRASGNHKYNWFKGLFSRNAAASIAIAIASFTGVAAIVGVGISHINNSREATAMETEVVLESVKIPDQSDTTKLAEVNQAPENIVFDDEPLETIMEKIAAYYGYKVVFNENASKSLRLYFRWNQALPIEEIVESLNNFEQITITMSDKTIKID